MLPKETENVWNFLRVQPALGGFILIGGSALALRISHRWSEDLDLVWAGARLPRARLEALRRVAAVENAFDLQPTDDEGALRDFQEAGLELHDYQQNFLVNAKVKLSFFAPEAPLLKVLDGPPEATARIGTLPELFKSKCLVSAQRSKTRDWLDLYLLLHRHGFTLRDYRAAFIEAGVASQCDTGLSRLCSGVPQKDDEGYFHLLPNPPALAEMKAFFTAQRDQLEIELAEDAARRRKA